MLEHTANKESKTNEPYSRRSNVISNNESSLRKDNNTIARYDADSLKKERKFLEANFSDSLGLSILFRVFLIFSILIANNFREKIEIVILSSILLVIEIWEYVNSSDFLIKISENTNEQLKFAMTEAVVRSNDLQERRDQRSPLVIIDKEEYTTAINPFLNPPIIDHFDYHVIATSETT